MSVLHLNIKNKKDMGITCHFSNNIEVLPWQSVLLVEETRLS
jgi:hypothetical protein